MTLLETKIKTMMFQSQAGAKKMAPNIGLSGIHGEAIGVKMETLESSEASTI